MQALPEHIDHERIPARPPAVPPVSGTTRPLWSVMIPVYNCARFLRETLESVLSQCAHRADVQIEVIDDASTDANVRELVLAISNGRVGYFRQAANVGSLKNFHTCLVRARGTYVHILHGDDKVRPGFYERFGNFFAHYPSVGAAYCRFAYIDESGKFLFNHEQERENPGVLENFVSTLGERQRIQYAAMVVRREVYETLGGFYGVEYGEDWQMWMRIAAKFEVGYIPEVLAEYRKHLASISGRSFLTGKNLRDLQYVMRQIEPMLPSDNRVKIIQSSKKFYAHYALRTANDIWSKLRHRGGVQAQISEAWKMRKDFLLVFKIVKLYTKMILNI
jgi:glycosyltransferase involved in cell wall biosynthesis